MRGAQWFCVKRWRSERGLFLLHVGEILQVLSASSTLFDILPEHSYYLATRYLADLFMDHRDLMLDSQAGACNA